MHSTRFTPFYLIIFWEQAWLPASIMLGTSKPESQLPNEYTATLKKKNSQPQSQEQMGRQHVRQKENYDKELHGLPLYSSNHE